MKSLLRTAALMLLLGSGGCTHAPSPRWITPEAMRPADGASGNENPEAPEEIRRTASASYHWVRLVQNEKPHFHDHHDLTVVVWRGDVRLHFEDHFVDLRPGDVILIPRGTYHWAERQGSRLPEALAIFSPPLEAPDFREALPG